MRERARQIGAKLAILSGAGTEVELMVPARAAYEKRRESRRFGHLLGKAQERVEESR